MLFFAPSAVDYEKILDNFKEVIIEENFASEVQVIDITSNKGKSLVRKHDVPEVPCLKIGSRYYFRDDIADKEKLKEVFRKNA